MELKLVKSRPIKSTRIQGVLTDMFDISTYYDEISGKIWIVSNKKSKIKNWSFENINKQRS